MVADGDHHLVAFDMAGQGNLRYLAVAGTILQGIVDEIADRLGQELAVGLDGETGAHRHCQHSPLFLGQRLVEFEDIGDDARRIDKPQAAARLT